MDAASSLWSCGSARERRAGREDIRPCAHPPSPSLWRAGAQGHKSNLSPPATSPTCSGELVAQGGSMQLTGFHHLTAVTADAARNFDFYTRILGLRLVKKTVNQDDVSAYHLFYADGLA